MKYVPPSVKETAFSCPHCSAFAHQHWLSVHADPIKGNGVPVVVDQEALKITPAAAMKLDPMAVFRAERARKQLAGVPVTWPNKVQRDFDILNIWMSKCFNCQKIAVWLADRMIYPEHSEAPPANADLPEDIRRDYDEARAILALSPRGAAALIRLAIQKLCRYLDRLFRVIGF